MMGLSFIMCALLIIDVVKVDSSSFSDMEVVYTNITSNYNKNLRPTSSDSDPTAVTVQFYLVSINEFDEAAGKLSLVGFFDIKWEEPRIIWSNVASNGIFKMQLKQADVWVPNMVLINTLQDAKKFGHNDLMVRFYADGNANWRFSEFLETSCTADITFYPFDMHSCTIEIIQLGYWADEVLMSPEKTYIGLEFYSENAVWEIVQTRLYTENLLTVHKLCMDITFKRRSGFFVLNMVIPILLMGVLNLFVFVLPVDSGERVGYSITLLLSITVFLTLISDTLPPASQPNVPLLCYFLISDLIRSSVAMICTIASLRIYSHDQEKPIPKAVKTFVKCITCCRHTSTRIDPLENITEYDAEKPKQNIEESPMTWKQVGEGFDAFCFIVFGVWIAISITIFFVVSFGRTDY